jgi:periplasmic protein TonB
MFQETLLESSSRPSRRRGLSLATAFTAQTVIAALLIVVPLLSSAVITISTPAMPVPISYAKPAAETQRSNSGGTSTGMHFNTPQVVSVKLGEGSIIIANRSKEGQSGPSLDPCVIGTSCPVGDSGPPNLLPSGPTIIPRRPDKPVIVSHMSEGLLINKVIPTYPMIANHAGVQGEVKLHAIIATDGTIQSLSVISGHPLLTSAALDAVRQWRYKPYLLNGQAVEVDTYITVNFKKAI